MWNRAQRCIGALPTDVYRVYDSRGQLLYVGASVNVFKRFHEHRAYAPWWYWARTGTVHRYENRRMARHVEALAIRDEMPRFNVTRERTEEHPQPVTPPIEVLSLWWDEDGDYWLEPLEVEHVA